MAAILAKGVIRGGRVEVEEPIDLPDGSPVIVQPANGEPAEQVEEGWDTSPEGIAAWLKWSDSLEALKITAEEQADADAWLK